MGIIIGGILGYKFGGFLGMLAGAWLGSWIEAQIQAPQRNKRQQHTRESYFKALFLAMGQLAKIDGRVSTEEIQKAKGIMRHMQLTPEMQQLAIDLFNQGKQDPAAVEQALHMFAQNAGRSLSLRQIFLEMLVDIAEADGHISNQESAFIERVCQIIGYPIQLLVAMMKMRGVNSGYDPFGQRDRQQGHWQGRQQAGYQQNRQQRPSNSSAPADPYAVLGVSQDDNKATIRRAYKKLMSQHHPDKLIAKGLPPEMMKVAEEKAKQIQQAWERVKELKGW